MQLSAWPSAVHPWPVVRDLALHAESRGYHGVWVMDHFMDNTAQGGGHVLEGFSVLAALAAVVPRVRLGSLVAGNLYRHIRKLQSLGLVDETEPRLVGPTGDERRIYYRLLPFGRRVLAAEMRRMRELIRIAEANSVLSPVQS